MKAGLQSLVVLLVVAMSNLYAYAVHKSKEEQVQGQVLGVEKHRVQSPDYTIGGSNPSDAPLTSRVYEYEVSIRVDCMTYVGTYQTPFNYLPAAFAPNQRIRFRLTKHVMYFDIPDTAGVRMNIVRRRNECGSGH